MSDFVFVFLLGGNGHKQEVGNLTHFGFALESKDAVVEIAECGHIAGCLAWEANPFPYPIGQRCALHDLDGYIVEFSFGQPLGPDAKSNR